MVFDIPPTMYIAQVYNCDAYGAANYNDCPVTSETSTTPSTTQQNSTNNGASSGDEPVTSDGQTQTDPPEPGRNPNQEKEIALVTPANNIAGADWTVIVPISLVISVLIAVIILLFKRHRRQQGF